MSDFLSEVDSCDLHQVAIEKAGGSDGIRDAGLLASALAIPQAGFGENLLHKDIPAMATAYLYHIFTLTFL